MPYEYFVINQRNERVPVFVRPATSGDLQQTIIQKWDSDRTSSNMKNPKFQLYSVIASRTHSLIALCAYEDKPEGSET